MMCQFKNVEEIDNSMFLGGGAGYFTNNCLIFFLRKKRRVTAMIYP